MIRLVSKYIENFDRFIEHVNDFNPADATRGSNATFIYSIDK